MLASSGVTYGLSQYATVDMVCYEGCQATGAGNCLDICQTTSPVLQAQAPVSGQQPAAAQLIKGIDNKYLLIGLAVIVGVVILAR